MSMRGDVDVPGIDVRQKKPTPKLDGRNALVF